MGWLTSQMPVGDRAPQQQGPAPAFVWGSGGERMTPAEISITRALAERQMATASDYSPVQSWAQGLARVAQGVVGGLGEREAREAAEANAAESDELIRAMASADSGISNDALVRAMTSPYVDDRVRAFATKMQDRQYEANKPQYFMAGNDRVVFDPATGTSQVLFDAPEEFEEYAIQLGLEPGSPEYADAMRDYVLRTNGPTAQAGRENLEGLRQDNRMALEGERQRNRLSLRGAPTYRDLHPRPSGGGTGRSPTSLAGVVAPILAKIRDGKPLTAAEQRAWDSYHSRRGGARNSGGSSEKTATDPKTGRKAVLRKGKWVDAQTGAPLN